MLKLSFRILTLFALGSLFLLSACGDDDDETPPAVTAQFGSAAGTVGEDNASGLPVTVTFSGEAAAAGTITLELTGATYSTDYTTSPDGASGSITLDVSAGSSFVGFSVLPVDNDALDGDKTVTVTLSSATGGVELGSGTTFTVTIEDNEGPTAVNFAAAEASVSEDADPVTVTLDLASAAIGAGTVDVAITSDATYTTDYTTDPDGSTGSVTLSIDAAATSATFTVTPVDNDAVDADRVITFTLGNPTGGIELGASQTTYVLTITSEDVAITTIADIRNLYDGSADVPVEEDIILEGVVTSVNTSINNQNIFIQDATAGIVVRFTEAHSYPQGQSLRINLNGSTITDFNNLVQIGGVEQTSVTDNGAGTLPAAQVITIDQMNSGDFQGSLVTIENVAIDEADGFDTFNGNNTLNDGVGTTVMRVESSSTFRDEVLPVGAGSVTGVAGVFGSANQILPQLRSDVFANNPDGEITLSVSTLDFGSIETATSSASQSYTVSFDGSLTEVSVDVSEGYEISLDDSDFSMSPLTVTTSGASVFVRFSPAAGTGGELPGSISHSANNAVGKNMTLTGIETIPDPPLFIETFETDGNGTRYTTSNVEFSDGSGDFFIRTDGTDIGSFVEFTNTQGASWFGAMDTDGEPEGGLVLSMDFTGIDISGQTGLTFSILVAEDQSGDGNEDWDLDSQFLVEYQIDGGGFQNLFAVSAMGGTNTVPLEDTDFDGTGDGTEITDDFQEFVKSIAGTGNSLDLKVTISNLNAGDEDIAFDNIKITAN